MPMTLRNIKPSLRQAWWCTTIIPTLKRLRQEDTCKFKSSLDYKEGLSIKKSNQLGSGGTRL